MIVETEGASTTKAIQQKIHNLSRFGCSAGGISPKVVAVLTVGRPVSSSVGSEAAILQREVGEEISKTCSKYKDLRTTRQIHEYEFSCMEPKRNVFEIASRRRFTARFPMH
jgi:hypothetical protein